jgi:phosphatidate cytidylyltransferase
MLALRQFGYEENHFTGAWWLLYVMLLVWGADSGAYMFGKLFGKHKLAPKVSPGKTWEGLIGGLVTSAVISWLFGRYAPLNVVPMTLLVCSVIAALASVLGDLTESMFKREAGIKDSGHLIPGHGGILDRIDSLTAAVPVFACLMLLVF